MLQGKEPLTLHQPDRRTRCRSEPLLEAVNDMLKAISASLLMEQVLAPRYEFTPKDTRAERGFRLRA